ncbi:CAP domain-containing protein [Micromonospora mirobrigensis]|uniref:Uncharacterized conserved protein YkwD, contains CAP (CSP/antigen 5/PR1) domain n=1 Tax=Micromonospora mirobrigensis TaxID=262898 RepID=A0A1C4U164_9ACTN|nr:CAP domain-containing protein [Micromonospora mirobrigensis]SCE65369.1 Uncharacterized conserved protein YkwD, contains CAP (CSP/antigen 5/PR1) domain [Micromonospora mirobrigensis]
MHGWTDPIDRDGAPRRPQPPTDEPSWLTDRPEPRSAYLFGDEPAAPAGQPGTTGQPEPAEPWRAQRPEPWQAERTELWRQPEPTGAWEAGQEHRWPAERAEQAEPWPTDRAEQPGHWSAEQAEEPGRWQAGPRATGPDPQTHLLPPVAGGHRTPDASAADGWPAPVEIDARAGAAETAAEGRHRQGRRLRRPLLVGGAAAAATLVVSLGAAALALPGGDQPAERSAADDTVATAPALPGLADTPTAAPTPAPTSAAPSVAPTTSRPVPSPTRARATTPAPSRTTAPSRRNVDRSTTRATAAPTTTAPSSAAATSTATTTAAGLSAELQQVVDLVNQERAKAGCKALSVDGKLNLAAQRHSQDQADHQNMSHDGSDGSDAGDRLDRAGYSWSSYGENVAWNQQTPAAVMDAWMNSPGHRANILNCGFTEIGVGVARSNGPYWTQDFATPR